jgi:hypothetical protein
MRTCGFWACLQHVCLLLKRDSSERQQSPWKMFMTPELNVEMLEEARMTLTWELLLYFIRIAPYTERPWFDSASAVSSGLQVCVPYEDCCLSKDWHWTTFRFYTLKKPTCMCSSMCSDADAHIAQVHTLEFRHRTCLLRHLYRQAAQLDPVHCHTLHPVRTSDTIICMCTMYTYIYTCPSMFICMDIYWYSPICISSCCFE